MNHKNNLLKMIKTLPTPYLLNFYFRNLTLSDLTDTAMRNELAARFAAE